VLLEFSHFEDEFGVSGGYFRRNAERVNKIKQMRLKSLYESLEEMVVLGLVLPGGETAIYRHSTYDYNPSPS
jgi:hypothetical protein